MMFGVWKCFSKFTNVFQIHKCVYKFTFTNVFPAKPIKEERQEIKFKVVRELMDPIDSHRIFYHYGSQWTVNCQHFQSIFFCVQQKKET